MNPRLLSRYDISIGAYIPPYRAEATCIKCGYNLAETYYQSTCEDANCVSSFCDAECLIRTCRRCQFRWAEAVIT